MKNDLAQMPLRVPGSLHEDLKQNAVSFGMSLNQFCLYILARHTQQPPKIQSKKAEELIQFINHAHRLQNEFSKSRKQQTVAESNPNETPLQRWKSLHESI